MPELYSVMDLVVLPSYREGIPRALMEGSVMGKPVVGTDVRGCRQVIVHGETGWLVPPKDALALGRAMESVLRDQDLASRMGRAGRRRAETQFDEKRVFEIISDEQRSRKDAQD